MVASTRKAKTGEGGIKISGFQASSAAARPLGRCDGGGRAATGVGRSHAPTALARASWCFTRKVVNIELSVVPCGQLHAIIEPYYVIIPAKTPGRPKIPWASEVGREIRNKNPAR